MPNIDSQLAAQQRDPARAAAALIHANVVGAKIRWFEARAVVPTAGGPGVGERIVWGRILPPRAKLIPHLTRLQWTAGAASSTVTVGDEVTTNRYLAATSVTTAGGSPMTDPAGAPLLPEVTQGDEGQLGNPNNPLSDRVLVSVVGGAALAAGQALVLRGAYVVD